MRLLLASLLLCIAGWLASVAEAKTPQFPPLTGRVVDSAGILDTGTVAALDSLLAGHEQQTGEQVVIATIPDLGGDDIADYGYQLGRAWGIGQKDKDNGALLIVAPNEKQVRIEVGYGLEGVLTDAISRMVIDQLILPRFRAGDIPGGIVAGTRGILTALGDPGNAPASVQQQAPPNGGELPLPGWAILLIVVVFLLLRGRGLFLLPFLGGGGWGRGGSGGGGFSGGGGSFGGGGSSGSW